MPCCPNIPIQFVDEASTTIAYTPIMQAQFGPTPRVYAWYLDAETGEFLQSSWFTLMKVTDGSIVVDHGGPATGFLVIR